MVGGLIAEFSGFGGLSRWLTELRVEILENPTQFHTSAEDGEEDGAARERRYAVNLFVDHAEEAHPKVVLESNPSYENLFGRIEYRQAEGTVETDFTLIRAGSLHRANGGVLVLRAEALAANPASWSFLKAARRDRLTARFELIEDLVTEAAVRAKQAKQQELTEAMLLATAAARRRRNMRIEDRVVRSIVEGAVMIDTTGSAVGQINALTITDVGDRRFGTPVRVTARASVGQVGIINIERDVELGGPIQQKGAMMLQGYLAGRFGQTQPPSFTCSITFEQIYGGGAGHTAPLAELGAVRF